ncbi:MAG: hypothetical protein HY720_12030 [Planctomycetes bacterium]|nr:hypothetical protein [Planctomycetota bacterium]
MFAPRVVVAGLLVAAAFASLAQAEIVILVTGQRIEGKVVERTAAGIVVEVADPTGATSRVTIPMDQVVEIRDHELTHDELIAKGDEFLAAGKTDEAARVFEEARLAKRGSAEAYHGLARVEGARGNFQTAIREARKGIILSRDHPALHRTLGLLYAEIGDFAAAIRTLERAIALEPFGEFEHRVREDLARVEEMAARVQEGSPLVSRSRKDFDPELGNNREACELGRYAEETIRSLQPDLSHDLYVELKSDPVAEGGYLAGGDLAAYRSAVRIVQFSIAVHPSDWARLVRLEQRELVGAWIRYAKDLYPFATVIAVVHNTQRIVLEAVWSDLRHDVIFHERRPSDR